MNWRPVENLPRLNAMRIDMGMFKRQRTVDVCSELCLHSSGASWQDWGMATNLKTAKDPAAVAFGHLGEARV
jgi:hypothetical protein